MLPFPVKLTAGVVKTTIPVEGELEGAKVVDVSIGRTDGMLVNFIDGETVR